MSSNTKSSPNGQGKCSPNPLAECKNLVELGIGPVRVAVREKGAIEKGWQTRGYDFDSFAAAHRPGENVGLRGGDKTPAGYAAWIDLDIRDPASEAEAYATLALILPNYTEHPIAISGSGTGRHILVFTPHPLGSAKLARSDRETADGKPAWEIEIKGQGGYVVAAGSTHPSGGIYRWEREPDVPLLSLGFAASVDASRLQKAEPERDPLDELLGKPPREPVDLARIQSALSFVDDFDGRHTWLRVGAALHHEFDGNEDGFEIWCEWSEQSAKFNLRDQKRTWKSFGKSRAKPVTIGTILDLAYKAGWWPAFDVRDDDFDDLPAIGSLDLASPDPVTPSMLRFISPDQCATAPKRGYVVKGLLAPRDLATVVGAPGAGKSAIAPLLGYMVAQGRDAFGQRTRQGGVFYVAAEDETGLQMRVAALRDEYGDAAAFQVVAGVSDLLAKESPDLAALVAAVKEQRPSLIFLDTLAMAFPGLEENDAANMGRVVKVARHLTKWGAAVVLIHHDTKAGDGLPRGHSILNGALDVSLALTRNGTKVSGNLSKNRNGPCDFEIQFEIQGAELGEDEDGELVTAALCRPILDDFCDIGPRNAKERAFMGVVCSTLEREGGTEVEEKALKVELDQSRALSGSDKKDTRDKAFKRCRDALAGHGVLSVCTATGKIKPLIPLDVLQAALGTGHAGQRLDKGKCPRGPQPDRHGHTP
ncbi:hypothetical protein DXV76_12865 [Rhodobacteraceae bacterium CCMM004]|nr:hypothetical protein DXV76_12865 [Rhodobacteraceae bacterium CCMM004]